MFLPCFLWYKPRHFFRSFGIRCIKTFCFTSCSKSERYYSSLAFCHIIVICIQLSHRWNSGIYQFLLPTSLWNLQGLVDSYSGKKWKIQGNIWTRSSNLLNEGIILEVIQISKIGQICHYTLVLFTFYLMHSYTKISTY